MTVTSIVPPQLHFGHSSEDREQHRPGPALRLEGCVSPGRNSDALDIKKEEGVHRALAPQQESLKPDMTESLEQTDWVFLRSVERGAQEKDGEAQPCTHDFIILKSVSSLRRESCYHSP